MNNDKSFDKILDIIYDTIIKNKKLSANNDTYNAVDKIVELAKNIDGPISHISFRLPSSYYDNVNKEIKEYTKGKIFACKEGCGHCCKNIHFLVPNLEIINIVYALNELDENKKNIIGNNINILYEKYKHIKKEQIFEKHEINEYINSVYERESSVNYNCPFQINEKCAIYENRPVVCRTYLSKSLENCINSNDADNILHNKLVENLQYLNQHPKNCNVENENIELDMSFPFLEIKYDKNRNKFYSISKYNMFARWFQLNMKDIVKLISQRNTSN